MRREHQRFCEALAIKAELGVKTREVYKSRDKEALKALIADYKKLSKKLELFFRAYKKQWFTENKPHGFDVRDFLGGGENYQHASTLYNDWGCTVTANVI